MNQPTRITSTLKLDDGSAEISILTNGLTSDDPTITIGDHTFTMKALSSAVKRAAMNVRAQDAIPGGTIVDVYLTFSSSEVKEYEALRAYRHLQEYFELYHGREASTLTHMSNYVETVSPNRKPKHRYDIIVKVKVVCKDTSELMEYLNGFHDCHAGIDICAHAPNSILLFTNKSPVTSPQYADLISVMTTR